MLAERTVVGTLRARCAGVDATSAQLRLGAQLSSAPLRPRGLQPSALLCVRSMHDPLPGTIRLDGMQLGPPTEWARAAEDALDQALRGAARPALGPVPVGAEAVLFADRAELLACLARDALDGTAWTRWWWATVMRHAESGVEAVAAEWLAEPAYVPAAFGILARAGHAAAYARTLRAPDALELAVRVARVFAAPELVRALLEAGRTGAPTEAAVAPQRPRPRPGRRAEAALREPAPAAAWVAVVPEAAAAGLSVEQEVVLAVSLMVSREPARARAPVFAKAVARSLRLRTMRPSTLESKPVPDERDEPEEPAETARAHPRRSAAPRGREPVESQRAVAAGARALASPAEVLKTGDAPTPPYVSRPGKPPAVPVQGRPSAAPPSRREARPAPHDRPATDSAPASRPTKPTPSARPDAVPAPTPVSEEQPFPRIGVETELGGLFFLLNVGLFLGLYGDFTTPDEPGIALDPWDFVALLGERLLGRDAPARDDAVWPLLARLAGRRPNARPGRRSEPPSDWRIPVDWIEPFDAEGEWLWSAADEKLRVVHAAGFPVVAVGLRGRDAQALLHRELRRYRVRPLLRRCSLHRESCVPLRRWIGRLGAYAAARIQLALGDSDRRHAVDTVLRRRATVFTTETHVDVSLSLSTLAIEIRLAGLDRDPGWIPAAGRFVAFHFE